MYSWAFTIFNTLRSFWYRWMNETKLNEKRIETIDNFKKIMMMPCNNMEGYGIKTRFLVKDSGGHKFYSTYYNQLQDLKIHVKGYFPKSILEDFNTFMAIAREVFMIYVEDDKSIVNLFTLEEKKKHYENVTKKSEKWEESILKYDTLIKDMEDMVK